MKNNNLHNIKSTGFKAPDDYFDSFDEAFFNKLKENNSFEDIKTTGFDIPNDYFETLEETVLKRVETKKETKVISLFSWKKVIYTSAIAASLILMINAFFNTSEILTFDTLETASIESYLEDEGYTSYELAFLLNENELNSEYFTNTNISESLLEDYLLDNTTIEDLLIE